MSSAVHFTTSPFLTQPIRFSTLPYVRMRVVDESITKPKHHGFQVPFVAWLASLLLTDEIVIAIEL